MVTAVGSAFSPPSVTTKRVPPRTRTVEKSFVEHTMPVREEDRSFLREHWPRLSILGCACVYGSNFAVVKTLDSVMCPSLSASMRFGLALLACGPIIFRKQKKRDAKFWVGAAEVGVINALGYVSQAVGLETVDASISAFVCSLAVVVVPALDAVVFKKRTAPVTWLGAAVAVSGVALLSYDAAPSVGGDIGWLGIVATFCQPFCFGYGFWKTENLLASTDDDPADAVASSLSCAAAQLAAVKATADIWLTYDVSRGALDGFDSLLLNPENRPDVLAAIVWTGLVTTFLTVLIETLALSKISARESSLIFTTEPVFGAVFASILLHEHFGRYALLGGSLVILACASTALGGGDPPLVSSEFDDDDFSRGAVTIPAYVPATADFSPAPGHHRIDSPSCM